MTDEEREVTERMGEILTSDSSLLDKARAMRELRILRYPLSAFQAMKEHTKEYCELMTWLSTALIDPSHPEHAEVVEAMTAGKGHNEGCICSTCQTDRFWTKIPKGIEPSQIEHNEKCVCDRCIGLRHGLGPDVKILRPGATITIKDVLRSDNER